MRSSMLMGAIEKPWLSEKDRMISISHWIVYFIAFLGIAGSAIRCYFAYVQTPVLGNVCLVMEDNFDTFDTDNKWMREVSMSGFGYVFSLHAPLLLCVGRAALTPGATQQRRIRNDDRV